MTNYYEDQEAGNALHVIMWCKSLYWLLSPAYFDIFWQSNRVLLLLLPLYLFCTFNWQIGASVEAWMAVLPRAWLFNKHLAPAPDPESLFWTLEGNAYFASGPLNVIVMLCRNSALMRFVWLQTT